MDATRLSTLLLRTVGDNIHAVSCAFVQSAISNMREYASAHRCDANIPTTSENNADAVEYTEYIQFLQSLEDGAKDLEITFEGVSEYLENTNVSLNLSLHKMKTQLHTGANGSNSASNSNSSSSNNSNLSAVSAVSANSINFYEEALVDLTNWLITTALQYAALPTPSALMQQRLASLHPRHKNRVMSSTSTSTSTSSVTKKNDPTQTVGSGVVPHVNMNGVFFLDGATEDQALWAIDSNLHARYIYVFTVLLFV